MQITFSDDLGTTTVSGPFRCRRKSLAQLTAGGWRSMNRAGCRGEWRRETVNTDTIVITEVFSAGSLRVIEWRAAA